jgi:hypothetical protein
MKDRPARLVLAIILNELNDEFGDRVCELVNRVCPNLTVCPDCQWDDFTHVNGCVMTASAAELRSQ